MSIYCPLYHSLPVYVGLSHGSQGVRHAPSRCARALWKGITSKPSVLWLLDYKLHLLSYQLGKTNKQTIGWFVNLNYHVPWAGPHYLFLFNTTLGPCTGLEKMMERYSANLNCSHNRTGIVKCYCKMWKSFWYKSIKFICSHFSLIVFILSFNPCYCNRLYLILHIIVQFHVLSQW